MDCKLSGSFSLVSIVDCKKDLHVNVLEMVVNNGNSICQLIKLHVNSAGASGVDRMSSFIAQCWEHFKDKSSHFSAFVEPQL